MEVSTKKVLKALCDCNKNCLFFFCYFLLQPCKYLLPAVRHQDMHKKCIVIDLDETLVHSSFKVNIY